MESCAFDLWLEDYVTALDKQLQSMDEDQVLPACGGQAVVDANSFQFANDASTLNPWQNPNLQTFGSPGRYPLDDWLNQVMPQPHSPNTVLVDPNTVPSNGNITPSPDSYLQTFVGGMSPDDISPDDQGVPAPSPDENNFVDGTASTLDEEISTPSSDQLQDIAYFQSGGDVTLEEMILDIQNFPAPHPGEDEELVAAQPVPDLLNQDPSQDDQSTGGDHCWLDELLEASPGDDTEDQVDANTPELQGFQPAATRPWPVKAPSESIGVDLRKGYNTWEAHIWLKDFNIDRRKRQKKGMQCFVGSFASEDDAKRAHDKAAIKFGVRVSKNGTLYSLNYPEEQYADYMAAHADWNRRDFIWKMRRESEKFSKGQCSLKGVECGKNGKYKASISVTSEIDGKSRKTFMTVGHFGSEEEAGREYDKALLFIKGMYDSACIPNFRPGNYSVAEVEEAGQRLIRAYPRVDFNALKRKHSTLFDD